MELQQRCLPVALQEFATQKGGCKIRTVIQTRESRSAGALKGVGHTDRSGRAADRVPQVGAERRLDGRCDVPGRHCVHAHAGVADWPRQVCLRDRPVGHVPPRRVDGLDVPQRPPDVDARLRGGIAWGLSPSTIQSTFQRFQPWHALAGPRPAPLSCLRPRPPLPLPPPPLPPRCRPRSAPSCRRPCRPA